MDPAIHLDSRSCPGLLATVVIPALNAEATLEATLRALDAQTVRDRLRVLVIDNGSTDATRDIAVRLADEVLLQNDGGCSGARNAGLKRTATPFMLSLDADCVPVSETWAEQHLGLLSGAPESTIGTAGRTTPMPTSDPWALRADITPHLAFASGRPLYAVAGNACFRTESLRGLGGFPEIAADDAGLGVRARRAGLDFLWAPEAVVHHRNPSGWRGYYHQMRKVGRYGVEIHGVPARRIGFYAQRLRYVPGVLRHAVHGRWHEAAATVLAAAGQTLGARETWNRALPAGEGSWLLPTPASAPR